MIDGFSISGYRSFDQSGVRIGDLGRLNIPIGRNNCGKSNVLRFLSHMPSILEGRMKFDPLLDFCLGSKTRTIELGVQVKRGGFTGDFYQSISTQFDEAYSGLSQRMVESLWFYYAIDQGGRVAPARLNESAAFIAKDFKPWERTRLAETICRLSGVDPNQTCLLIARHLHEVEAEAQRPPR